MMMIIIIIIIIIAFSSSSYRLVSLVSAVNRSCPDPFLTGRTTSGTVSQSEPAAGFSSGQSHVIILLLNHTPRRGSELLLRIQRL